MTTTLYRPIGEKEYVLIAETDFQGFPPRLEWQPIFYPVLNIEYASEIASQWNTNDEFGNYLGIVTQFELEITEFEKYKIENVGGAHHNEIWVPAENLNIFNRAIVGKIEVVEVFVGENFRNSEYEVVNELLKKHRA